MKIYRLGEALIDTGSRVVVHTQDGGIIGRGTVLRREKVDSLYTRFVVKMDDERVVKVNFDSISIEENNEKRI